MPTRKHKKNLKTFENCFSSAEVIDWLHKNLQKNSNFGTDVTREQTIQLLSKLARAGIIENVRDEEVQEFREGELYKLSNKSPVRNIRTPGKVEKKVEVERVVLGEVGNTPRSCFRNEDEMAAPLLQVGSEVACLVTGHNRDNGRISLSTRALEGVPGELLRDPVGVFARAEAAAAGHQERRNRELLEYEILASMCEENQENSLSALLNDLLP